MLNRWLAPLLLLLSTVTMAQAPRTYVEGTDYIRTGKPMPVSTGERIEVLEFFAYTCVHCAEMEPHLQRWKAEHKGTGQLVYMPALFGPDEVASRAHFAAAALGKLDVTHKATFDARFIERQNFTTLEQFADFYASKGVDRAKFLATAKSFGVNAKIAQARKAAKEYAIDSTPTLIVDGKFILKPKTFAEAPALIDHVVALAAAERVQP